MPYFGASVLTVPMVSVPALRTSGCLLKRDVSMPNGVTLICRVRGSKPAVCAAMTWLVEQSRSAESRLPTIKRRWKAELFGTS